MIGRLAALAGLLLCSPAAAQIAVPGGAMPGSPAVVPVPGAGGKVVKAPAVVTIGPDGLSAPIGKQEAFPLIAANVPSAPATVFGGNYILEQTCTAYGTVTIQRLGPDGTTYLTIASYTASDTMGGHALAFGSLAKVRMTVSGTTGCNALLARVPA